MTNHFRRNAVPRKAFTALIIFAAATTAWTALTIEEQTPLGAGSDTLSIALLADLHIGESSEALSNLTDAVDTINGMIVNGRAIKLAVILGDLSACADSAQLAAAKSELDRLAIPYVPLIGNHDMWPYKTDPYWRAEKCGPAPDSLMPSRFFSACFDSAYGTLQAISDTNDTAVQVIREIWGHFPYFRLTFAGLLID